jgi:hypothetical protein
MAAIHLKIRKALFVAAPMKIWRQPLVLEVFYLRLALFAVGHIENRKLIACEAIARLRIRASLDLRSATTRR